MTLIKCLLSVLILYVLLPASGAFDCHQVHNNIHLLNASFGDFSDRNEPCRDGDTTCVKLAGTYNSQSLLIKGCLKDFTDPNGINSYIKGDYCANNEQTFTYSSTKLNYNVKIYCCTKDNCNLSTILLANLWLIIVSVILQIVNNVNAY
uniref:UPAR/Ly6 domain-containing protein n=1 Tax=Acrobeloides nanus TaxID=290746 RepID=A0A914DAL1_9BILA